MFPLSSSSTRMTQKETIVLEDNPFAAKSTPHRFGVHFEEEKRITKSNKTHFFNVNVTSMTIAF